MPQSFIFPSKVSTGRKSRSSRRSRRLSPLSMPSYSKRFFTL
jgi:hypothetical protein